MKRRQNRRRFLAALGTGSLAFAAGCSGQLPTSNDDDESSQSESAATKEGETAGPPPAISHGEVVSDFDEDFDEWFALDGEITADEEEFLTNSQTVRIEGSGRTAGIARSFPDGLDIKGHHLSLAVRVEQPRPARVTVRLLAPGEADQLWSTRTILEPYEGWLRMDVGYTRQRGEPLLENIQELQIRLDDPNAATGNADDAEQSAGESNETETGTEANETGTGTNESQTDVALNESDNETGDNESGGDEGDLSLAIEPMLQMENGEGDADENDSANDIRFWVDDLRMTPKASQGYVMLVFDDAVASQYENAFPLCEERDMQAVAAVVPTSLNRPGRLNIDHLREMRDAGWDISSHPDPGAGLTEVGPEEARDVIESSHEYLDQRGFPDGARHMFVPYHDTNQEIVEITREYHELSSYFGGMPNAVPPTDPLHLSRVNMHDLDGFTSMIDMAAEHNQLAIGLAHGVVPEDQVEDDPHADMSVEQLEKLLDYIEQSDVQLITASDLIDNRDDL